VPEGTVPRILDGWTERADGTPESSFRMGDTAVLQGIVYEPDDRPPVVLFGIVRADGTPVYGSHSDEGGFTPVRIAPRQFAFAVRLEGLSLLPGKYHLRLHTLDAEALRLFDTLQTDIVVAGETRDYGLVGLPHRWEQGRGARP
jgi:lipopolysaccharide transport system ATP-binding protein